jgi:hypothetical protein
MNLRPGLSYLLDDAGPLVPAQKVSIPFFAFVGHSSAFPSTALVRDGIAKPELKFGRLVAVSWKIAIDFETDAHFDKCGSCP